MSLKYSNKESGFIIPIAVGCIGAIVAILVVSLIIISVGANMFSGKRGAGSGSGIDIPWLDSTTASLPSDIRDRIDNNWSSYVAASLATGVDPKIIAALHYREASNDPTKTPWDGLKLISEDSRCDWPAGSGIRNLTTCSIRVANHIVSMAQSVYGVDVRALNTSETLKKSFLSYNRGYMYLWGGCGEEESPYVMNQYNNTTFQDMLWPVKYANYPACCPGCSPPIGRPCGTEYCEPELTRGNNDSKIGAYPVFLILMGGGNYSDPNGGDGGFSDGGGDGDGGGGGGAG